MANTFTRKLSRNIGTTATQVGSYTVGASTVATVIGLTACNKTAAQIAVDVFIRDVSSNDTYLVKGAPINTGGTLVLVGGDQKVVLTTGDAVYIQSSAATSVDAVMSVLEIS